uniref:Recombination signal binding protein for immunoglobulin kappa J region-like n=1 Tax=Salarias fasciatus TaxID=181472 RepID=A0A672G946_SALFA
SPLRSCVLKLDSAAGWTAAAVLHPAALLQTGSSDPQPVLFACAKSLFISDQDKRKHFCLLLRLFLGNRQEVGSFQSRMIKVISKPSQKRQSMKNADLCISSCSRVALFNRLRSQTVSTRYLSVEGGAFIASARQWTAFTITMGFLDGSPGEKAGIKDGFSNFSETFRCLQVIRKVNKQHAILDVDEPVSQLHKCAFQFRDDPQAYLCLSNDTIVQYQVGLPLILLPPDSMVLNDGACWTIIGVEATNQLEVISVILCACVCACMCVSFLQVNGGGHVAMLEIHGENFSPHLKVWFGNSEAETMFKSPKSLLCVVPDVSVFSDGWRCLRRSVTVPLALIRLDGLIYRTSFSFTYTPELQPPPAILQSNGLNSLTLSQTSSPGVCVGINQADLCVFLRESSSGFNVKDLEIKRVS